MPVVVVFFFALSTFIIIISFLFHHNRNYYTVNGWTYEIDLVQALYGWCANKYIYIKYICKVIRSFCFCFSTNEVQSNWFQPIYSTNWTRTMLNETQSAYACVLLSFLSKKRQSFSHLNQITSKKAVNFSCLVLPYWIEIIRQKRGHNGIHMSFFSFSHKYMHANTITFTQKKTRRRDEDECCSGKKIARLLN